MSRRKNKPQQPVNAAEPELAAGDADVSAEQLPEPGRADVKPHLRCPCCWNGQGGVGKEKWWRRINGTVVRRAYSCNQCDCNWSIKVRTITVVEGMEYDIIESGGDE